MDTTTLLPPRARAIVYVITAMLGAVYVVAEANVDLVWGWMAAYGAWNVGAGLLAAANTRATDPQ